LCAKDPGCVTRWGGLEKGVVEIVEQSAAQPIAIPRQRGSGSTPFLLSTASAVFVIQQRVYDEGGLATLPLLIDRIRAREGKALVPRIDSLQRSYDTMNHDVFTATECYESFPFDSVADYERNAAPWPAFRRIELIPIGHLTDICPMWSQAISTRVEPLPAAAATGVPVLVGAGEFDPVTPVESSRKLASALHARLVEFPFGSHGVFYGSCGAAVQQAFLDHPQAEPDVTCISRLEPLRFDTNAVLTRRVK
jgi:pimeloyl-ACP methyl ester carboxylesterase